MKVQGLTIAGYVTLSFAALLSSIRTPASPTNSSIADRGLSLICTQRSGLALNRNRNKPTCLITQSRSRLNRVVNVNININAKSVVLTRRIVQRDYNVPFVHGSNFDAMQINASRGNHQRKQNRPALADVQLVVSRLQRRFGHAIDKLIKRLEFVIRDQLRSSLGQGNFWPGNCGFRMDAPRTLRYVLRDRESGGSIGSAVTRFSLLESRSCARRMT